MRFSDNADCISKTRSQNTTKRRNNGIINPSLDGFTYYTCGHFALSLPVFFLAPLGTIPRNSQNIRAYYMLSHSIRCIYYSTIAPYTSYYIWSRERAKYEPVMNCSVLVWLGLGEILILRNSQNIRAYYILNHPIKCICPKQVHWYFDWSNYLVRLTEPKAFDNSLDFYTRYHKPECSTL